MIKESSQLPGEGKERNPQNDERLISLRHTLEAWNGWMAKGTPLRSEYDLGFATSGGSGSARSKYIPSTYVTYLPPRIKYIGRRDIPRR